MQNSVKHIEIRVAFLKALHILGQASCSDFSVVSANARVLHIADLYHLDMGKGLSWKIYGKDITDAAGDIDFDVTVGADAGKSIPVDVINNVPRSRY